MVSHKGTPECPNGGEQASIPRCPGDQDQQQVDHKCLPQAHPHGPLHPIPFPSPPEDCHWCVKMYAGQGQQDLRPHIKTKGVPTPPSHLPSNGFLAELVRKTLSHQTRPTPPQPVHEDLAEPQKIMCLPYIRGLSERGPHSG